MNSKRILFAFLCTILSISVCGAELEKVKPLGYDFKQPTLNGEKGEKTHGDPGKIKLLDGIKKSPSRIIWLNRDFSQKPVEIAFNFPEPVNLKLVKLHIFRWKKSYGLKRINIFGKTADGKQVLLGGIQPNQPYELPKGEPYYMPLDVKLNSEQAVSSIKISIVGISRISLTEVEFFAAPIVKKKITKVNYSSNPFNAFIKNVESGFKLIEKDFNGDGKTDILLQNDRMIYIIDLAGGIVNFAFDKQTKTNLIKFQKTGSYGGMLNDRFWPGGTKTRDVFKGVPYSYKIVTQSKDKLAVKVWASGKSGFFSNVIINKTYSLKKNDSALRVDYHITNDKANVVPLNYGFWIMGGVFSGKEKFNLIYPGTLGVVKNPAKRQSLWTPGAVSGWVGMVTESGKGLALVVDYKLLKTFYFWGGDSKASTIECRSGIYPIKAGGFMDITCYLVPFNGIGTPNAISSDFAGSLDLEKKYDVSPKKINLNLQATHPGNYQIEVEAGRLIGSRLNFKKIKDISQQLGTAPVSIPVDYKLPAYGTWVFRVTVKEFGKKVLKFNAVTDFKRFTGTYAITPECKKRPESGIKKKKINLDFHSLSFKTPHVNWARPFAGGKPKVLVLCRRKGAIRDAVEVAERFELDLHTNLVTKIWQLGDFCTVINEKDCYSELTKKLSQNQYNSIVVSSNLWKYLPEVCKTTLLSQVKNGAGLVLIAPESTPAELTKNFTLPQKTKRIYGSWKSAKNHTITAGIPFEALPASNALPYSSTGKVLATINDKPLIATFNYGKGRVVATSWSVDGRKRHGYHNTYSSRVILPIMLYSGVGKIKYNYWEYQISLLAKMIYWTARVPFAIEGRQMKVTNGTALSLLVNSKSAKNVKLDLTIRDKFYNIEQHKIITLNLKSGENKVKTTFKKSNLSGMHFADVIIKSEKGTEWWGSAAFKTQSPVSLIKLTAEDKVWKKSDTFKCSVKLSSSSQAKVELSLYDSFGNEFARTSKQNKGSNIKLELPLKDCRALTFQAHAKVIKNNKIISEMRKRFALYGTPDGRIMQIAFGWPNLSMRGVHRFLMKAYFSRLQTLGATALKLFRTDIKYEIMTGRELGLPIVGSNTPTSSGGKFPFDKNKKINSKFDLLRKPCLSAKGFKNKLENISACEQWQEKYGVLYRGGPDEANSINRWDGCFSKGCQHELRNWLKKQYSSLADLNNSWKTNFTAWDQVIAMTAEEVKNHGSYAPWIDHLTFNDWNRADAISRIVKGLKKINPKLHYALSGTQDTRTYNAWNWYLLMKSLGAVESYGGEQTVQQRCFFKGKLIWNGWIGYDRNYDFLNWQILNYLMQGATGFNIYSGGFYVNPDYTFPNSANYLKRALDNYKNGPAEAIINSKMMTYPIAFLYSPASIKVDWMLDLKDERVTAVSGFNDILRDSGLDYDCIAYKQLENSNLLQEKYKALFLPLCSAMSDKEIAQVKKFVANGGILIADMMPGGYDQHGKPRLNNPLDEVFGISRNKSSFIKEKAKLSGIFNIAVKVFETGIKTRSGKALASIDYQGSKHPAIIVNKYGKGTTVYFACSLPAAYGNWQVMRYFKNNLAKAKSIRELIINPLSNVGIKPRVKIENSKGENLKAAYICMKQSGAARILGVVRNHKQAKNIDAKTRKWTVKMLREYHVYDLLKGKYLGHGREFPYNFGPTSQSVFTLLPYKVNSLELKTSKNDGQIMVKIAINANTQNFANHIFRVEVKNPAGQKNPAFAKMLFANGGSKTYSFPAPLNAVKGIWSIEVTDVFSGTKRTEKLNIK
jgi:Beta-galactosidase trimerisation domain/Beta-galactosidase